MLTGGGALAAYDSRTSGSQEKGHLGGLLQATLYLGGISGGSWLVMSTLVNDFKPIGNAKDDKNYWALQERLLEGVSDFDATNSQPQGEVFNDESLSPGEKEERTPEINSKNTRESHTFVQSLLQRLNIGRQNNIYNGSEISKLSSLIKPIFLKNQSFIHLNNSSETTGDPEKVSLKEVFSFYKDLIIEVRAKRLAGFFLSLTDYWGRALARRIFHRAARSPGATLTAATQLSSFKNYEQPFPVICAIEKAPDQKQTSKNSYLFEFNPYEFGSWDSYLNAFAAVKYLGTKLVDGTPAEKDGDYRGFTCVNGFDNVGFLAATSSCIFNHVFIRLYQVLFKIELKTSNAVNTLLQSIGLSSDYKSLEHPQTHPDYSILSPNPFFKFNRSQSDTDDIIGHSHLYFTDGGSDGQNIPFQPFLQKARKVDIIFSYDMTSDFSNYPNGTTLVQSMNRFHNNVSELIVPKYNLKKRTVIDKEKGALTKSIFPFVPDPNTLINLKLNKRPLFLGCDLFDDYPNMDGNRKTLGSSYDFLDNHYLPPLIVYIANTNLSYLSNTSTFQLSYTHDEASSMVENGYNLATEMNSTSFSVCVSCAIMKRNFDRVDTGLVTLKEDFTIPQQCKKCYQEYCWSNHSWNN